MKWKTDDGGWSPYLAGALLGVLAIISVYATTSLLGKSTYIGASTTFVRVAGFTEQLVAKDRVESNEYYKSTKIKVDWQFMLIIGLFAGALISSLTDKSFKMEGVPPIWKERFGPSVPVRAAGAFLGGMVAMVGARLADGCPSGHGLSGMMQLSVSSFVALIMFFGAGILAAHFAYGRRA